MLTTTLTPSDTPCSVCGLASAPRLCVTLADDPADLSRSALTQRSMSTVVCRACMDRAFVPRNFARSRFDACPAADRAES